MNLYPIELPANETVKGFALGTKNGGGLTPIPLPAGFDGFDIIGNGARLFAPPGADSALLISTNALHVRARDLSIGAGGRMCVMVGPECAGHPTGLWTYIDWEDVHLEDEKPCKWGGQFYGWHGIQRRCRVNIPNSSEHGRYSHGVGPAGCWLDDCETEACGGEDTKWTWRCNTATYVAAGLTPRKHHLYGVAYLPGKTIRITNHKSRNFARTGAGGGHVFQGIGGKTHVWIEHGSSYNPIKGAIAASDGDGAMEFYGSEWDGVGDPAVGKGIGNFVVRNFLAAGGRATEPLVRVLDAEVVSFSGCGIYGPGFMSLKENAHGQVKDCNTEAIREAAEGLGFDVDPECRLTGQLVGPVSAGGAW